jgi:cell division protein FtsZ
VLLHATQGISTLVSVTGLVNVDFADVRTVMQNGGSALMGTGIGRGEDRALEAAQQAISSPLLDDVSINGSTGVLVNITGGEDLTLGEVNQISEIIHDAAGDDAEIIFGAVHDPAMAGEVRVTVIATGFDRKTAQEGPLGRAVPNVLPFPQPRQSTLRPAVRPVAAPVRPAAPPATPEVPDVSEMEIPTFIRRQMD